MSERPIRRVSVIGPGIVGMPMAAMLAHAFLADPEDGRGRVTVVQRGSPTSGWKVDAINAGRSPIGGVEPDLDRLVAEAVSRGTLGASHDPAVLADADAVLVCVQTDKSGLGPDYGPLFEATDALAQALRGRPAGKLPVVIYESTLAPSSMATVVRDRYAAAGLVEGRDILLANSPNRVMPGRLVERVRSSDKLVGALRPETADIVARLYGRIVTQGTVHRTNSLTAEVVKTLENAYRDVRIAYAAEVCRWCDDHDVDFFALRDLANARLHQADSASRDPGAVPSGGLLVPTLGVGGHCLPKDGILLWWRRLEAGGDTSRSLILEARRVNDASPAETMRRAERMTGPLAGRTVALMGAAYRFDSEDTRNSPTLVLARLLLESGCDVRIQDPHVRPDDANLQRFGLASRFTPDFAQGLAGAEVVVFCVAHRAYVQSGGECGGFPALKAVVDACNFFPLGTFSGGGPAYTGIGRGRSAPDGTLVDAVVEGFRTVERGVANEVAELVAFLSDRYASDVWNRVALDEVRRLAATCVTGCDIAEPGPVVVSDAVETLGSSLVARAAGRGT
jgi:UDP-N-acetyl-D-mannosaminuronic acid dehydrogenase